MREGKADDVELPYSERTSIKVSGLRVREDSPESGAVGNRYPKKENG